MKLYLDTKKLTFNEENNKIEHEILMSVFEENFIGCDYIMNLPDNDSFIKDTFRINKIGKDNKEIRQFKVRADGWNSFPLYEVVNDEIVKFNYEDYAYFADTDRRMALAQKVNALYNPPSEAKIVRKTLKKILDHLGIEDESFEKYNNKVETIIKNNPKNWKN